MGHLTSSKHPNNWGEFGGGDAFPKEIKKRVFRGGADQRTQKIQGYFEIQNRFVNNSSEAPGHTWKCKMCNAILKQLDGGFSSLLYHLQSWKHEDIWGEIGGGRAIPVKKVADIGPDNRHLDPTYNMFEWTGVSYMAPSKHTGKTWKCTLCNQEVNQIDGFTNCMANHLNQVHGISVSDKQAAPRENAKYQVFEPTGITYTTDKGTGDIFQCTLCKQKFKQLRPGKNALYSHLKARHADYLVEAAKRAADAAFPVSGGAADAAGGDASGASGGAADAAPVWQHAGDDAADAAPVWHHAGDDALPSGSGVAYDTLQPYADGSGGYGVSDHIIPADDGGLENYENVDFGLLFGDSGDEAGAGGVGEVIDMLSALHFRLLQCEMDASSL